MSHGKRYRQAVKQVDTGKLYGLEAAVELVKKTSTVKFDAAVEMHFRLGIDPKKADQAVRGTVSLPHGTGRKLVIAVFATGQAADEAKKAGADHIGAEDLIKEIKTKGATNFDIAVATPEMMKSLAPIAKTLGQRGLMPNPKNETVNPNPAAVVKALRAGKIAFRSDDTGNAHQMIGRISFPNEQLVANARGFLDAIKKAKPSESKGTFMKSVTLTSTMGPAVKIDPSV